MEKIEILSEELFVSHRAEQDIIERFLGRFTPVLGWHYLLDLVWLLREVRTSVPRGGLILDAGAGTGILQFVLAEHGYNVISADFTGRCLPEAYRERYGKVTHNLNSQRYSLDNRYTRHLASVYGGGGGGVLKRLARVLGVTRAFGSLKSVEKFRFLTHGDEPQAIFERDAATACGRIFFYRCDLGEMPLLPDGFVDGVVSLSALEHNDHDSFVRCMTELLRVTKKGGPLAITVSASQSGDWFHEPSQGWCYSEATLKCLCRLPAEVQSNFARKEELLRQLSTEGCELHKRLSPAYFQSGSNGMPWGKWKPAYQPVGVLKLNG